MTTQIVLEDFLRLALRLRDTAVTHNVSEEHRASLIGDVVFQFASFLDERQGSSFHESIYGLLEDHEDALSQEPKPAKAFIAQLEITFGKGRKKEVNILSGNLKNMQFLQETVEFTLGLRSLDELYSKIDSEARFTQLMSKKNGIKELRFNSAESIDTPSWIVVPLEGSQYGTFEQSLSGLCKCIFRVVKRWT